MDRVNLEGISDNKNYQDIALLVDRDIVLRSIISIRHKLRRQAKKLPKFMNLHDFLRYYPDSRVKVYNLLTRFKYPPGFMQAVLAAIQNNKITHMDMKNCYYQVHVERIGDKSLPPLETPRDAVLLTIYPYLLKGRQKMIINQLKNILVSVNQSILNLPEGHPLTMDTRKYIRRDRNWYWKKQEGNSASKILDEYNASQEGKDHLVDVNIVEQAVSEYRRLLKTVF